MTTKIFKYKLIIDDKQMIQVPEGSLVLTCQLQRGEPYLWVQVGDSERVVMKEMIIEMYGTGHSMEDSHMLMYVSTIQMFEGAAVWHVFERL